MRLEDLCCEFREDISKPFSELFDGVTYNIATDGKALVAVADPNCTPDPKSKKLLHVLGDPTVVPRTKPQYLSTLFQLDQWLSTGENEIDCEACDGSGDHCCGCPHCSFQGVCGDCEGDGTKFSVREFSLGGVTFDATLMWRYVRHVGSIKENDEPVSVTVRGPSESILIHGNGWIVCVMPRVAGLEQPAAPSEVFAPRGG